MTKEELYKEWQNNINAEYIIPSLDEFFRTNTYVPTITDTTIPHIVTNVISKELLSTIINNQEKYNDIKTIVRIKIEGNLIRYNFSNGCILQTSLMYDGEINIYELANSCKKWVYNLDEWTIESGLGYANIFSRYSCADDNPIRTINASTEPEAIFAACQWILDNK